MSRNNTLDLIEEKFFTSPDILNQQQNVIDYVIEISVDPQCENSQQEKLSQLLANLILAGLQFQIEKVDKTLFVIIHCPRSTIIKENYSSRIEDWLKGIGDTDLKADEEITLEKVSKMTPSHRYRLINQILKRILVSADLDYQLYPLHDAEFNQQWVTSWSSKWIITIDDLQQAKNHFGEEVALYFYFLQTYFFFLAIPAALGVVYYLFGTQYSFSYCVITCIWGIFFINYWEYEEKEIVSMWGIHGCSKNDPIRLEFKADKTEIDQVTGREKQVYSSYKRFLKKLITIPVILSMVLLLIVFTGIMFVLDMFFQEYYNGPFKTYVSYVPLVLYSLISTQISTWYASLSKYMNEFENYETESQYEWQLNIKLFISNFLANFSFPLLNGLIYIPFGHVIARFMASYFELSLENDQEKSDRFGDAIFEFIMTGQVINAFQEILLPVILRKFHRWFRKEKEIGINQKQHSNKLFQYILEQSEKDQYDLNEDYNEMIMQFACVVIFGPIWSLTALAAFVNNWLEVRSDAVKISLNARRPIPKRTESIGPWLFDLKVCIILSLVLNLTWQFLFDSNVNILNSLLGTASQSKVFFEFVKVEHGFILAWILIKVLINSMPSRAEKKAEQKDWELRQKYLKVMKESDLNIFEHLQSDIKGIKNSQENISKWQSISFTDVHDNEKEIKNLCQTKINELLTDYKKKN